MTLNQLIEESKTDFSKTTSWRVLTDNGFVNKTAPFKWLIPEENRIERLKWANKYLNMTQDF